MVKQIAKRLIVLIILKNFNKRELHYLINKRGHMNIVTYGTFV